MPGQRCHLVPRDDKVRKGRRSAAFSAGISGDGGRTRARTLVFGVGLGCRTTAKQEEALFLLTFKSRADESELGCKALCCPRMKIAR